LFHNKFEFKCLFNELNFTFAKMAYHTLKDCVCDLQKHKHLITITDEVDPYLEMAAIHLRTYAAQGPAIHFKNIKNTKFSAVSNLFGTIDRSKFIFRNTLSTVKKIIALKGDPISVLKNPFHYIDLPFKAIHAIPKKTSAKFEETTIDQLPLIHHWPLDGGAFITLPIVYSESPYKSGPLHANIGMYRIQLSGNDYILNEEIGLHYQLHRGIGVHQTGWNKIGKPMKVSIFVGGPPSHSFSAVMPLPEGLSEIPFAGILGGRRFRYHYNDEGYLLSNDADFVITGEVISNTNKIEGPFGDHLGYYSLQHEFPVLKVHKVYHRKDAIWAFTVVGRPPQEDTSFGHLIHEITGDIVSKTIPGLHEVHAVDAAGVHPLLLAIGSERYTPYIELKKPQELLTIANAILGFGQMSLAKYLFIIDKADNENLSTHNIEAFFIHVLERVDFTRDIHFYTNTTIDTLDYSGDGLNMGSKVVIAAAGRGIHKLATSLPQFFDKINKIKDAKLIIPGIVAISISDFQNYSYEQNYIESLCNELKSNISDLIGIRCIIISDNAKFVAENLSNFLWVTFTRSNPAKDIYGVDSFIIDKHWGCNGPLIIDARKKPHHAPELLIDPAINKKVDKYFAKGGALEGIEK
jgi:4-hydroxy-3-polyprenylbenzoate decarboxylase